MKNLIKRIKKSISDYSNALMMFLYGMLMSVLSFSKRALAGNAGEGYIDTAVKILIAVVLGALLLSLLYALFNNTIMPTVTQRINDMFNYAGGLH